MIYTRRTNAARFKTHDSVTRAMRINQPASRNAASKQSASEEKVKLLSMSLARTRSNGSAMTMERANWKRITPGNCLMQRCKSFLPKSEWSFGKCPDGKNAVASELPADAGRPRQAADGGTVSDVLVKTGATRIEAVQEFAVQDRKRRLGEKEDLARLEFGGEIFSGERRSRGAGLQHPTYVPSSHEVM